MPPRSYTEMLAHHRQDRLARGWPTLYREALPRLWADPPPASLRATAQRILRNPTVRRLAAAAFAAHVALISVDHPLASAGERAALAAGGSGLTWLLSTEVAAGLWAFGPRRFLSRVDLSRPGPLELAAALGCLASAALGGAWPPPALDWIAPGLSRRLGLRTVAAAATAGRAARLLRCTRLLGLPGAAAAAYEGLATTLRQLYGAAPAITPILALRAIMLYILGVLVVQLFGGMCVEGAPDDVASLRCRLSQLRLGAHGNFAHIGFALRTLFVYGMGNGWCGRAGAPFECVRTLRAYTCVRTLNSQAKSLSYRARIPFSVKSLHLFPACRIFCCFSAEGATQSSLLVGEGCAVLHVLAVLESAVLLSLTPAFALPPQPPQVRASGQHHNHLRLSPAPPAWLHGGRARRSARGYQAQCHGNPARSGRAAGTVAPG